MFNDMMSYHGIFSVAKGSRCATNHSCTLVLDGSQFRL